MQTYLIQFTVCWVRAIPLPAGIPYKPLLFEERRRAKSMQNALANFWRLWGQGGVDVWEIQPV